MLAVEIAAALIAAYVVLIRVPFIGGPWLVWWHGAGEAQQYQFYRCHACRRLVTHMRIRVGGCPCLESSKISPAKLTVTEKARLLYVPWTVTPGKVRRDARWRARAAEQAAVR